MQTIAPFGIAAVCWVLTILALVCLYRRGLVTSLRFAVVFACGTAVTELGLFFGGLLFNRAQVTLSLAAIGFAIVAINALFSFPVAYIMHKYLFASLRRVADRQNTREEQ